MSWERTGNALVSVRWVDVRKGSGELRSRLVRTPLKFAKKGCANLSAVTPPLEGKSLLVSGAVTFRIDRLKRKLRFIDAKTAHLNLRYGDDAYVELQDESRSRREVYKPQFWLDGFQKVASVWEDAYADHFEEAGFARWKACGVLF